jgi:RNase adapter protein RapZ
LDAFAEYGYNTLNAELTGVAPDTANSVYTLLNSESGAVLAPKISAEKSPEEVGQALVAIQQALPNLQVLLLNAPDETLVKRYLDSGKTHPFESHAQGVEEAIALEKKWLNDLRAVFSKKDFAIDTSTTTPTELRLKIARVLNRPVENQQFTVYLTTFGFKYGAPQDAELMFDMRFMSNPFYDENLRHLTGKDPAIRDFLFNLPQASEFFDRWSVLIAGMLPFYRSEGKTRLAIAIGCTGGKHRSVCMGESLAAYLQEHCPQYKIVLTHRETQRWGSEPASAPTACAASLQ